MNPNVDQTLRPTCNNWYVGIHCTCDDCQSLINDALDGLFLPQHYQQYQQPHHSLDDFDMEMIIDPQLILEESEYPMPSQDKPSKAGLLGLGSPIQISRNSGRHSKQPEAANNVDFLPMPSLQCQVNNVNGAHRSSGHLDRPRTNSITTIGSSEAASEDTFSLHNWYGTPGTDVQHQAAGSSTAGSPPYYEKLQQNHQHSRRGHRRGHSMGSNTAGIVNNSNTRTTNKHASLQPPPSASRGANLSPEPQRSHSASPSLSLPLAHPPPPPPPPFFPSSSSSSCPPKNVHENNSVIDRDDKDMDNEDDQEEATIMSLQKPKPIPITNSMSDAEKARLCELNDQIFAERLRIQRAKNNCAAKRSRQRRLDLIRTLQDDVGSKQVLIEQLSGQLGQVKSQVDSLQGQVGQLQERNAELLRDKVASQTDVLGGRALREENERLRADVGKLQELVRSMALHQHRQQGVSTGGDGGVLGDGNARSSTELKREDAAARSSSSSSAETKRKMGSKSS